MYLCITVCVIVCLLGYFEQAQLLFEEMQNRIFVPVEVMASILPQIVNDDNALKFIETNLNEGGQLQVCMYVCMYVYVFKFMYVCMYVCTVCMYVCW